MTCGIYGIRNQINQKIYIGQSKNIEFRWKVHKREIKYEKHVNEKLMHSYKKYGPENFDFIILETCEIKSLDCKEQEWIDKFPEKLLLNIVLDVQYRGDNNPFYGKKHTIQTRKKMSNAAKSRNYNGENNPNYGNVYSFETRKKLSKCAGKLSEINIFEIVEKLKSGIKHQEIADEYQISRTVITRISNGTRWVNITGGPVFPVVYDIDGKRILRENHKIQLGRQKGKKHTEKSKKMISETRKLRYGAKI